MESIRPDLRVPEGLPVDEGGSGFQNMVGSGFQNEIGSGFPNLSDPVFKIWLDPGPVLKIWLDSGPDFIKISVILTFMSNKEVE